MMRPKDGSRKAEVFDVFFSKGEDAARKRALKLKIKEGTIKSWFSLWGRASNRERERAAAGSAEGGVKRERLSVPSFDPHFRYMSRTAAEKGIAGICSRCGSLPAAFHIIEHDNRFAIAPAHYKPPGPIPQFKVGDIVFDTVIPNSKAKVTKAGPEQTEIRYFKEHKARPMEVCIPNVYLYKFEERKASEKGGKTVKRERL